LINICAGSSLTAVEVIASRVNTRALLSFVLLFVLASACKTGAPKDPLAEDRARLLALAEQGLPPAWSPQAAVVIGPGLVEAQLSDVMREVAKEAKKQMTFSLPLASKLVVVPKLAVTRVGFAPGSHDDRVKISGRVEGTLTPRIEGMMRIPLSPFPFAADLSATLGARLSPNPKDKKKLQVLLDVEEPGVVVEHLEITGLPKQLQGAVADTIVSELSRALQVGSAEFMVSEIPDDPHLMLRGLRVRPARTAGGAAVARIELGFVTLEAGTPTALPDPSEGFVLVVPEQTLFGLARAAALRAGPIDEKYSFEPTEVKVTGDEMTLALRIWEISPNPRSREYAVISALTLDKGELKIEPKRGEERGLGGFAFDPVSLVVRGQVLSAMQDAMKIGAPVRVEQEIGDGQKVRAELVSTEVDEQGQLLLRGRIIRLKASKKPKSVKKKTPPSGKSARERALERARSKKKPDS
jgi:hypothetical protein